ncbi:MULTISPECIES: glycosyltransferase [unclassified Coleofasciculus]|uniref:glycosyltransferase n=1 Tax=unclassified Coleofasciculus TaxID=2692782 RepID=UPI001882B95D|nr:MULTISPECIES: glycosyltransferase [unclassified Coleofasciculus]MBE9126163.1 glycosyltransferase family 2 protein [Coleofasciculus sp. LEGE 07081]MBE9149581.1 glycosyltransferase family 2 protein [Coleofasciculus sp. LEGE 07092]
MVEFTVAICTYNGENLLPAVLDSLRSQIGHEEINWEIIVLDNNSCDNTANVVTDYQDTWKEAYPIRYYRETQQGLAFARRCAIKYALKRFFRNNGLSRYSVRMLNYKAWQIPLVIPAYMINDLRKLVFHWLKYRRVLKNDKVAAGEMELLLAIFISHFYKNI